MAAMVEKCSTLALRAAECSELPPEAEPLLVRLVQRCRVALAADVEALTTVHLAANPVEAPAAASGCSAGAGQAAAGADQHVDPGHSHGASGRIRNGQSVWAVPPAMAVAALQHRARRESVNTTAMTAEPDSSPEVLAAVVAGGQALIAYLAAPGSMAIDVGSNHTGTIFRGLLVAEGLGPAAGEPQQQILGTLATTLAAAAAALSEAGSGRQSGVLQAAALARLADAARALSTSVAGAEGAYPAFASPSWRPWGESVSAALLRVMPLAGQQPSACPGTVVALHKTALSLAAAGIPALRAATAGGVTALEQDPALWLLTALARLCWFPGSALGLFAAVGAAKGLPFRQLAMAQFRDAAGAAGEAADVAVAAAGGSGGRTLPPALAEAACVAAHAFIGEALMAAPQLTGLTPCGLDTF